MNQSRRTSGCLRLLLGLLLVLGLLLGAAFLYWNSKRDQLVRDLFVRAITKNGSCQVELGPITVSRNARHITLGPTVFANPAIPTETPMLAIEGLKAELRPLSVLRGRLIINNLEADVAYVTLQRLADGRTNFDCLGSSLAKLLPPVPAPKKTGSGASSGPTVPGAGSVTAVEDTDQGLDVDIELKRLKLKIDQVALKDFGRGGPIPLSAEVEVNFDETYEFLKDLDDLESRLKHDAEEIVESFMLY